MIELPAEITPNTIVNDQTLAQTRFVKLVERTYYNKECKLSKWTFAQRNNNRQAVMIIAYVDGKLAVTKEYRVPIADYEWSFPAGLIDDGESPEMAAKRELKEETGLELIEIIHRSPFMYNSAGITDEQICIIYCHAKGQVTNEFQEEGEDIETFLMTEAEVNEILCGDHQFSAKAYMEMREFAQNGAQ